MVELACLNEPNSDAGGGLIPGTSEHAGLVDGEGPDIKGSPGSPGQSPRPVKKYEITETKNYFTVSHTLQRPAVSG